LVAVLDRTAEAFRLAMTETPDEPEDEEDDDDGEDDSPPSESDPEPLAPPEEEDKLLPVGNPLRILRGPIAILLGSLVAFVIMALRPQLRWGVPVGALGVLVAAFGLLDLVGSFDDPDERVATRIHIRTLGAPLGLMGGGFAACFALVTLAVVGVLPVPVSAVGIPAAFLTCVVGVYRVGERLGVWDSEPDPVDAADVPIRELARRVFASLGVPAAQAIEHVRTRWLPTRTQGGSRTAAAASSTPRTMFQRHGFWLVVATTVLYLPMLGSHSLSDPWETHYGEVSREILARNDWTSLWWAQDGWFWSKPVLNFWIQALAMASFGVRYQPGQMLSAAAEGRHPWPEWAVRLPIFLLTLAAVYLLYKAVAKVFGRRAGLLGGLVLVTMPQWFMVSHQTMTDMPFVAPMAATMALFLLGVHTDPEREVKVYEVDLGFVRLRLSLYHLVLGAVIMCVLPQVLYLFSRNLEIRLAPFAIHGHLDTFTSGSAGNCGLPGNEACRTWSPVLRGLHPALQGLIWVQALAIVLYINWGERRLSRLYFHAAWLFAALSTMGKGPAGFGLPVLCALAYVVVTRRTRDLLRMEIVSGLLILAAVALPWFVAMYARHGQPFTDRLLFHDMFKRAFTHVHDTNEGDDVSFRYYVWQLGYAMFPWTGLAPAALVAWLRRREDASDRRGDGAVFFALWFVLAFALFSLMLTKFHHYILPAVAPVAMLVGVLLDDILRWSSRPDEADRKPRFAYERLMTGAIAVAGALLVFAVGRDFAQDRDGLQGEIRLMHLFTYNYKRPWPASLDYTKTLWVFVAAASVATLLLVVVKWRRHVTWLLLAVGLAFAAWGLDVYFVQTSPHWGQRETFLAYTRAAHDIPGPIVAYQMNWKGENFYAGNQVPAFVSSGKKFQDWILEEKKKGVKTFYFMTEHGRTGTLANELGQPRVFEKLTTPELNNKFVLVRASFEP